MRFNPFTPTPFLLRTVTAVFVLGLCCVACTHDAAKEGEAAAPARESFPTLTKRAPVHFSHAMGPLGDTMRALGEATEGAFVLMSGLEERSIDAVSYKGTSYEQVIANLADAVQAKYVATPHYYLIFPEMYDALQHMSLDDQLSDAYKELKVGAVFGAKTNLFVLFAALSKSLDITIVADNYIAEARCGEIHLPQLPLGRVLEAMLQSARIAPDTVSIECTDEYIFLKAPQNENADTTRISPSDANAGDAMTERIVSLCLPDCGTEEEEGMVEAASAIPLHEALLPLPEQLGVEIVAQRALADIPINPCILNNVKLSTALDLLIRQWPLPYFGWEYRNDRILIRER
ncbi:MAG: hypothetical protein GX117_09550 [Candidatus Hydrogenedentes bacterium]|nr:hypothetical protein [Candidatus Hydrogenedentota bacterium]